MSAGINPGHLLRQARELAGTAAGRGRPRPTDLRRAVSSGYYALFHGITGAVAANALPNAAEVDMLRLTRSISHQAIRDVARWVVDAGGPEHLRPLVAMAHDAAGLAHLAESFLGAQESRHRADYDHLWSFSKAVVLNQLADVESAIDALTQLRGSLAFDVFAASVLLKSQPR